MNQSNRYNLCKSIIAGSLLSAISISCFASSSFNEAPKVTELVKNGQLPPVEERLPEQPLVVNPIDSIGKYGGTLNLLGLAGDIGHIYRVISYDPLFAFDGKYNQVIPNLATGFEANENNTEFTIFLRKGVKWSDGHPFTAEDIAFYINDYINEEGPVGNRPFVMRNPGDATAQVVDKYTLKIKLKNPNGMFIRQLATVDSLSFTAFPKHFCSQYFPKYNKDAIKNAKEAGMATWIQMAETKCSAHYGFDHFNVERPVLNAWKSKVAPTKDSSYAVFERNPYYYQVDSEGNQLPYLDSVRWRYSQVVDEMLLRAAAGETDYQLRHLGTSSYRPFLIENEKNGNYTYQDRTGTSMNSMVINLNQNVKDPVKAKLFSNKDFRIALSHAIDREEISETVYSGISSPYQAAPKETSVFYDEEMATQYTEYDLDKANKVLDSLGLDKRDEKGIRLMEDGRPLRIDVIVSSSDRKDMLDSLEIVKNQWKDLGILLDIRTVELAYHGLQRMNMDYEMLVNGGDGGVGILDEARYYMPWSPESTWGPGYYKWSIDKSDKLGVEPPKSVKRQIELRKMIQETSSQEKQIEYMKEVIAIAKDNFFVIGTVTPVDEGVIVSNKLRNVPQDMPQSYNFPTPGPMKVGQLWKEE